METEDIRSFLKVFGASITPVLIGWIWYLLREKWKDTQSKLISQSKKIHELEEKINVMLGTLGAFGKSVSKDLISVKNEITFAASTSNQDITLIRSEITNMHIAIIELRKFANRHESALAMAHKLFNRHAADLAQLHNEHKKRLV